MITKVSASEVNTTDTVSTTDNLEVSVSENNTGEVAVAALPNTNSNNDGINVEGLNKTSNIDDGLNVSDENSTSNFELEQSNNVDDSVKNKEEILGAMDNILTISSDVPIPVVYDSLKNNEDNMLGCTSNELLSENPSKTYTISDGPYHITISVTLISDYYEWEVKEMTNHWNYLYVYSATSSSVFTELSWESLSIGYDGIFSGSKFGESNVYFCSISSFTGRATNSNYAPLPLSEVDTTVSVTNPSVKYNSGNFGVSGTVTIKMI